MVFISPHAQRDAQHEDLVDDERARRRAARRRPPRRGRGDRARARRAPSSRGAPFLLCLGTDFLHKNRVFALDLLAELRRAHGFEGRLVFAGPHAAQGTLGRGGARRGWPPTRTSRAHVVDVGQADEPEKAWLYENTALVLYPTVYEGFGFIPYEAAEAGSPALWAAQSSMADLLPVRARGDRAVGRRGDGRARGRADRATRRRGRRRWRGCAPRRRSYTWERTVEQLIGVYREAATAPARASAEPRESLTDLAMSLVGPKGWLTPDDQLALLAVSARPALKRTVFSALRGGYRAMYRVRRARGGGG